MNVPPSPVFAGLLSPLVIAGTIGDCGASSARRRRFGRRCLFPPTVVTEPCGWSPYGKRENCHQKQDCLIPSQRLPFALPSPGVLPTRGFAGSNGPFTLFAVILLKLTRSAGLRSHVS